MRLPIHCAVMNRNAMWVRESGGAAPSLERLQRPDETPPQPKNLDCLECDLSQGER
jgi:hypothetical protein